MPSNDSLADGCRLDVEIAPLPQGHQHAHVNTIDRKTQGSEVSEAALNLPGTARQRARVLPFCCTPLCL